MRCRTLAATIRNGVAVLGVCLGLTSGNAYAALTFTYQGRFLTPDGTAPLTDIANITFSIYNSSGTCLLEQEVFNGVDLSLMNGIAAVSIGTGTRTGSDPSLTMEAVLSNRPGVLRANAVDCIGGYSPSPTDGRMMQVHVDIPSRSISTDLTPSLRLDSVPLAYEAQKLQGYQASDFILAQTPVTQTNLGTLTNGSNADALHRHDAYVKVGAANAGFSILNGQTLGLGQIDSTSEGSLTGLTPGSVWFNSTTQLLKYYDGTNIVSIGASGVSGGGGGATTNFTGALAGDVRGTQSATVVALVSGVSAANVASGANAANAAASINTPNTLIKRDGSGDFTAGTITATNFIGAFSGTFTGGISGNAAGFSGALSGDVTGGQTTTIINTVGGLAAGSVVSGANAANAATTANSGGRIVARDGSGNFSAGVITATLNGNSSTATSANFATTSGFAATATSAANFTGVLVGDVTGNQSTTVVGTVGGVSAGDVASGANAANAATSASGVGTLVKRDSSGSFSANIFYGNLNGTASLATFSGTSTNSLAVSGPVTASQLVFGVSASTGRILYSTDAVGTAAWNSATTLDAAGNLNLNSMHTVGAVSASGEVATSGGVRFPDGSLQTSASFGGVTGFTGVLAGDVTGAVGATTVALVGGLSAANVASGAVLANAATATGTTGAIVRRDAAGDFSAGVISAALNGNASTAGFATTAGSANTATSALYATSAGTASSAAYSTLAATATSAGYATFASAATTASYATSASTATTASYATSASTATSANYATLASTATTANYATTASAAVYATTAGVASSASYATYAETAGSVGTASTAAYATSASTATTANYATSALNFTGLLAGEVTGTQGATVVSSVTVGALTGVLPVSKGGTNVSSVSENGVVYGGAGGTSYANVAGTSGQVLMANSSGVPTFTNSLLGLSSVTASGTLTGATIVGAHSGSVAAPTGGLTVGANQLVVTASGVGIGTTGPTAPLSVVGNAYIDGTVTAATFVGSFSGTPTINANLNGPIGSSGNTTFVTAQTGTGSTFVMSASPGISSPNISGGLNNNSGGITNAGAVGGITNLSGPAGVTLAAGGSGALSLSTAGAGSFTVATSGATRMTIDNSGNVGIGTSSPSKMLDILDSAASNTSQIKMRQSTGNMFSYLGNFQASTYISSGGTYAGSWIADSTNTIPYVVVTAGSGDSDIAFGTSTTNNIEATERLRITGTGNVGIGTTSPVAALHLRANAGRLTGLYLQSTSSSTATGIVLDGTNVPSGHAYNIWPTESGSSPGPGFLGFFDITESAYRMVISPSGNVGIGTIAPSSALHVMGLVTASSGFSGSFTGTTGSYSGLLTASSGLTVSSGLLTVSSGGASITGLVTAFSGVNLNNQGIAAAGPISGITSLTGAGAVSLSAGGAGALSLSTAGTGDFSIATSGSTRMTVDSNGNVGIGMSAPQATLNVYKDFTAANWAGMFSTNPYNAQLILGDDSERLYLGSYFLAGLGSVGVIQASDYFSAADHPQTLLLNPYGGFIGIGTISPASILQATVGSKSLGFDLSSNGTDAILKMKSTATNNWTRLGTSGSPLAILTQGGDEVGGTPTLFIGNTGSIGIGITDPQSKLDIVYDGAVNNYAAIRSGYWSTMSGDSDGRALFTTNFFNEGNGSNNYRYVNTHGSIGYAGMEAIGGMIRFLGGTGATTGGAVFTPAERMRITATGNVGIGTTAPTNPLSVAGNANFTGTITAASFAGTFSGSNGVYTSGLSVAGTGITTSGGLVVSASGASITGGLNNNSGGITNAGAIGGLTSLSGPAGVSLSAGGAGTLSLSTAGTGAFTVATSGSTRMTIDSNGNVGIGTTGPAYPLDVSVGSALAMRSHGYDTLGVGINIITENLSSSGVRFAGFLSKINGNTAASFIGSSTELLSYGLVNGANISPGAGTQDIGFRTGAAQLEGTASQPSMVIKSSGNVGIGTASPTNTLQVGTLSQLSTVTPVTLSLGGTYSPTGGQNIKLKLYDDGSAVYGLGVSPGSLDYRSNVAHQFYSGNTHLVTITSGGSVGIGTASPNSMLSIVNSGTATAPDNLGVWNANYMTIGSAGANGAAVGIGFDQTAAPTGQTGYILSLAPGVAWKRLAIESSELILNSYYGGRVGIGTKTPLSGLHVAGAGTGATWISATDSTASASTTGYFNTLYSGVSGDPSPAHIWSTGTDLRFGTWGFANGGGAWLEKMRITSGGNVGIGTPTPNYGLDVRSTSFAAGPAFSVYSTSSVGSASLSYVKIPFNTVDFDTDSAFDTTNRRFRPAKAGYYQINLAILVGGDSNGAGTLFGFLYKNGALYRRANLLYSYGSGSNFSDTLSISTLVYLNGTTDYIEGYFMTNNSNTMSTFTGSSDTYMTGYFVRSQ